MSDARDLAAIPLVEPRDGPELHLTQVPAGVAVSPSCSVLLRPSLWLPSYSRRLGSEWVVPTRRQRFASGGQGIRR